MNTGETLLIYLFIRVPVLVIQFRKFNIGHIFSPCHRVIKIYAIYADNFRLVLKNTTQKHAFRVVSIIITRAVTQIKGKFIEIHEKSVTTVIGRRSQD